MKLNSIKLSAKSGITMIMALCFGGIAACVPAYAGEGCGPHSGFHGRGGLGRGGYHFGDRFEDHHPRRSEVLGRDNRLNWALNKDRGRLDGQYGQLKQQQLGIRRQEQADARANGGYITKQQQAQFNQDENQLRQQIQQDLSK